MCCLCYFLKISFIALKKYKKDLDDKKLTPKQRKKLLEKNRLKEIAEKEKLKKKKLLAKEKERERMKKEKEEEKQKRKVEKEKVRQILINGNLWIYDCSLLCVCCGHEYTEEKLRKSTVYLEN